MAPKLVKDYQLDHKLNFKVDDPCFEIHNYDLNLKSNEIYLFGIDRGYEAVEGLEEPGVDYVLANRFIKNLHLCIRKNPKKPIVIHMKTNGGDWNEGMAIYDAIMSCPWPVTILNYTHARSMSSIIFQAANKRVMMPHSHFMFHDGTYGIDGTLKQVRSNIAFDKKNDNVMLEIYAKMMQETGKFKGKTIKYIKNWLRTQMDKKEDVFLTCSETISYGLADEIYDYNLKKLTQYTSEQMER